MEYGSKDAYKIYGNLSDDMTVVTAFFNIGNFGKGSEENMRGIEQYQLWMTIFSRIANNIIVFVDNDDNVNRFISIRSSIEPNRSLIIKLNHTKMWSFGLVPEMTEIFNQPGYARHYPNTVIPNYTAVTHAKFEVLQMAVESNPFMTKYFCWLDIGYFRDLVSDPKAEASEVAPKLFIYLPPHFDEETVAVNEVYPRDPGLSAKDIIFGNNNWVLLQRFVLSFYVIYCRCSYCFPVVLIQR